MFTITIIGGIHSRVEKHQRDTKYLLRNATILYFFIRFGNKIISLFLVVALKRADCFEVLVLKA